MANLNIDSVKELTYDAIVIGSGISGGWAAKELTEKGLRVLMLERGHQLEHVTDYENAFKAPWELKYNGKLTTEQIESHPKLSRDYPYNEMTEKYWFNDADSLYQRGEAFRLVPAEYRGRQIDHVGPAIVSAERPGFRSEPARGDRGGLADPLCGHRAVVFVCGKVRGHLGRKARAAAIAGWRVSAADGNVFRGEGSAEADRESISRPR